MQAKYPLINIDPVAVSLGPLDIHWYGVMYLLAFLSFWAIGNRRAVHQGWWAWSKQDVSDILFYGMLGVILGGRIGYMLFYGFDLLIQNPLTIFKVWDGGMSFHGGLLGVMIAMAWFARKTQRSFWQVADFVAPMVPLGLAFGRLGNFIGGELWGRLSDVPWAMIFAKSTNIRTADVEALNEAWQSGALDHMARHPSQLYQAGMEGLLLFMILMWFSSKPRPRAAVSGLFMLGYGLFRLIAEFFRQPDEHLGFLAMHWLTMGMLLSLPMIAFGLGIIIYAYRSDSSPTKAKSQT
ncbi:MAG: prolipoprotein diacylglyceryl transferase [Xanthomonadales bacterium]|nr:prolipoprotein diacylglyceryl transferase [Xanthomonadales bacterium]